MPIKGFSCIVLQFKKSHMARSCRDIPARIMGGSFWYEALLPWPVPQHWRSWELGEFVLVRLEVCKQLKTKRQHCEGAALFANVSKCLLYLLRFRTLTEPRFEHILFEWKRPHWLSFAWNAFAILCFQCAYRSCRLSLGKFQRPNKDTKAVDILQDENTQRGYLWLK